MEIEESHSSEGENLDAALFDVKLSSDYVQTQERSLKLSKQQIDGLRRNRTLFHDKLQRSFKRQSTPDDVVSVDGINQGACFIIHGAFRQADGEHDELNRFESSLEQSLEI